MFVLAFWGAVAAIVFVASLFVGITRDYTPANVIGLLMLFSALGLSYLAATPSP